MTYLADRSRQKDKAGLGKGENGEALSSSPTPYRHYLRVKKETLTVQALPYIVVIADRRVINPATTMARTPAHRRLDYAGRIRPLPNSGDCS